MVRRFVCVSFIAMMALPAVLESVDVESLLLKRRVMKSPMQTLNVNKDTVLNANNCVTSFFENIKKCLPSEAESQIEKLYVLKEGVDITEARNKIRARLAALEQHKPQAREELVGAITKYFRFDRDYYKLYLRGYIYAVENVDEANEFFRRDANLIVNYLDKKVNSQMKNMKTH